MVKKTMRTVYLSKELDNYISNRMLIEDRKRSALIERLIKKCLAMEEEKDLKVAMDSEPRKAINQS